MEEKRYYEIGLIEYLQHDLDGYKRARAENSMDWDCWHNELEASLKLARIEEEITSDQFEYLWHKYILGE